MMDKFAKFVAFSLVIGTAAPSVFAQGSYPVGGVIPIAPTPSVQAPQTFVAPAATPTVTNSTPVFVPPPITTVTDQTFTKDLTNINLPKVLANGKTYNSKGVKDLGSVGFSTEESKGAIFHAEEGSKFQQIASNAVKLESGSVLLSLHGPSASVETANGKVQVKGEGDVLTSYVAGVMRVANITARGTACRVQMNGAATESDTKVVALAPGYELVVGDRNMHQGEIRPADGIARRNQFNFQGGHVAVNEFSVASILTTHPIVAAMLENTTRGDRRCINEMCKMAAVMNYVHGSNGYKPAEGTGIATKPGANTQ